MKHTIKNIVDRGPKGAYTELTILKKDIMNKQCPLLQTICLQSQCAWWTGACAIFLIARSSDYLSDSLKEFLTGTPPKQDLPLIPSGVTASHMTRGESMNEREPEQREGIDYCDGCDYYAIKEDDSLYCLKYRLQIPNLLNDDDLAIRLNICSMEQGYSGRFKG